MLLIRNNNIISIIAICIAFSSSAQLPSKLDRFVGKWEFSGGSGYETFEMKNNELHGKGYLSTKSGALIHVEDLSIALVNRNLIYKAISYKNDTIPNPLMQSVFVSNGRNTKFFNTDANGPTAIKYKVSCFNKHKMKIIIYPSNVEDKKRVLRLTKVSYLE